MNNCFDCCAAKKASLNSLQVNPAFLHVEDRQRQAVGLVTRMLAFAKLQEIDMSLSSFFISTKNQELYSSIHQLDIAFLERFWRCESLLHFLAHRILGTHEEAGNAVDKCRIVAARNPPEFEYESAFRSWVARILIDEALATLRQRNAALTELSG